MNDQNKASVRDIIKSELDDFNNQEQKDKLNRSAQTKRIKMHFDDAANRFDTFIRNLIPYYSDMVEMITEIIPFEENDAFEVIDLGCGTGTISYFIKNKFKNAQITCMDISENMLEIAADKIGDNISCICEDLNTFIFDKKYDVVVSSLALHHLETDLVKFEMYQKIHRGLKNNGIFINLDILLGSSDTLQTLNMKKWIAFMEQNVPSNEVFEKWLPNYYAEDRPISLITHINLMQQSGFEEIDVVFKYYNYALFCGRKGL